MHELISSFVGGLVGSAVGVFLILILCMCSANNDNEWGGKS